MPGLQDPKFLISTHREGQWLYVEVGEWHAFCLQVPPGVPAHMWPCAAVHGPQFIVCACVCSQLSPMFVCIYVLTCRWLATCVVALSLCACWAR